MPRPIKTLEQHLLHGSKPQNVLPGAVDLTPGVPANPKRLSPGARKIFRQLCALMEERRSITRGDSELLRLYAQLWDRQRHAQAKIDEQGEVCAYVRLDSSGVAHDQFKENLWLGIAERAEKTMLGILVQLGLTPAARQRVRPLKPAPAPMTEEEIFFSRGPRVVPFKPPEEPNADDRE